MSMSCKKYKNNKIALQMSYLFVNKKITFYCAVNNTDVWFSQHASFKALWPHSDAKRFLVNFIKIS